MTAEVTGSADCREDGGGAVPQDEGAALSTVENGEAVAIQAEQAEWGMDLPDAERASRGQLTPAVSGRP